MKRERTRRLAEFIAETTLSDIPMPVVERVRSLVVDAVGVGMFGSGLPWTRALEKTFLGAEGAAGPSAVWGRPSRLSAPSAAAVNATAVHGFELDDYGVGGHSGCVTLPPVFALAESHAPLSGADAIVSIIVGMEVQSRVAEAAGGLPSGALHKDLGFHGPGVLGTFAAAASSAKALALDVPRVIDTLGHAGQQASGLMFTHHGGMGKRLLAGNGARTGVFAALLAESGFTNNEHVFEAEYGGFLSAHSGHRQPPRFYIDELCAGLGSEWHSQTVAFKLWACRAPIHQALEGLQVLRSASPFTPDEVQSVDVYLGPATFQNVGWEYVPNGVATAQLNLRYAVAALIAQNDVFIEQFRTSNLEAPDILTLVERVHTHSDPALAEEECFLQVKLVSGATLTGSGLVRGSMNVHERTPFAVGADEVDDKFRKITRLFMSNLEQDALLRACRSLPELPDTRDLIRLMRVADLDYLSKHDLSFQ